MKLIFLTALHLVVFTSIAQEVLPQHSQDSLQQKMEALQQKIAAQEEQLLDLKYENTLLRKEAHKNNGTRRGFGNRSRVVVDRRGSKQAYVIYY